MALRTSILSASLLILLAGLPVSAAEAAAASRPAFQQRLLERFDRDGDGTLSPEERAEARRRLEQRRGSLPRPTDSQVPESVRAHRDIEYARVDGKPLRLDVYVPEAADGPLPVIVWIHGGGWQAGSKERCPALPLSARGYAVVSINYRLTGEAPFPAQIHDCKAAIRWVRAHAKEYGFDPDRVGAWGSSAGGHLVALLGTSGGVRELEGDVGGNLDRSSRVQAVCDCCGPASFREEDFPGLSDKAAGDGPQAVQKLLGGPLRENRAKARMASPVEHVTKDDPPFLIVHGDKDPLVPLRQSTILAAALKKAGVEVTLHVVPGGGHGVLGPETLKMAAEFFDRHLKSKTANEKVTR